MTLTPDAADLHGAVRVQGGPVVNIGFWDNPQDSVTWNVHFALPGTYAASAKASAAYADTAFTLDAGPGASVTLAVPKMEGWDDYHTVSGGTLTVAAAGDHVLTVRPADPAHWRAMNLASVTLTRKAD